MYSWKSIQPYYFKADLIWCDGTFKVSFISNELKQVIARYVGVIIVLSLQEEILQPCLLEQVLGQEGDCWNRLGSFSI